MSSNSSNFYAEKIYAQHPLAVWSLDDESYYISKITESDRQMSLWTVTGGTATTVIDNTAPFSSSYVNSISGTGTPTYGSDARVYLSSPSTFSSNGFTISFYLKTQYVTSVSAGYGSGNIVSVSSAVPNVSSGTVSYVTYTTTTNHGFSNGEYVQINGNSVDFYDTAGFVSDKTNDTFRIYFNPPSGQGTGSGGQASGGKTQSIFINPADYPTNSWIPISFIFNDNVSSQKILLSFTYSQTSPQFFVNGLTIGKDSQPFNGESLGQTPITIPSNIATTQTSGIVAKSYGIEDHSAYYICDENNIYAKNSGVSMSYGSNSSMRIYPNATSGQPSFIFPAFGMLNEVGRYKTFTLQTLIKISSENIVPKRILGPLASNDGIYVAKNLISLKIGDNIGSFYFSDMYKPTLLQFKMSEGVAKLSLDGEEVISLQVENSSLSLPQKLDNSSPIKKNQDWFGFYAYSDIPLIEVGSLAIFPYYSSEVSAKLNLVYAQSISLPDSLNSFSGETISPDFELSNYINNYNYPSFQSKWEQATFFENLEIVDTVQLSSKNFIKPGTVTSLYDSDKLLLDVYETFVASSESNTFVRLRPSSVVSGSGRSWSNNQGYFLVNLTENNDYLSNCIYGVFKSLESSGTEQILIKVQNNLNNNYFQISLINTTLYYKYKYNSDTETQIATKSITQNSIFAVGVDIQKLIKSDQNMFAFFSNSTNLQVTIGGKNELTNTFSGNIYKVGLCSKENFKDISSLFSGSDVVLTDSSSYSSLLSKIASYTFAPFNAFGKINLDISTNGYWQDYIPLSRLAKTVIDETGSEKIDLEIIQLNIDFEEPRTYSSGNFSTSSMPIRSYITFQTLSSGASKKTSEFATLQSPNKNRLIDASTFSSTTKYEFVNGMTVIPPKNVDLSTLAIVLHIEVLSDASILKPIRLKNVQLAAKSFDKNLPNKLGTKYNIPVYPYTYYNDPSINKASTFPYNYNLQNPYLVYKSSTPHLYLNRHSGFRITGSLPSAYHRGLYANIGNFSPDKKIVSVQLSILPDIESFSLSAQNFLIFKTNSGTISFKINSLLGDSTKGIITSDSDIPIVYYLNGRKVGNPVINIGEWNVLAMSFTKPLDISNSQGRLFITSDLLVNDISYSYANPTELDQKSSPILWSQIKDNQWRIPVPTQTPTRSGNSITLNTTGDHNLVVGERLTFYGIIPDGYGIGFGGRSLKISKVDSNTSFTYENSNAPTTAITTAGTVAGTWEYATIPNYYSLYGTLPDTIYEQFVGKNRIAIDTYDDSLSLTLNQYKYSSYMDVKIDSFTLELK